MTSPNWLRLTLAFVVFVALTMTARADLAGYSFSSGTGDPYDMSGATNLFEGSEECSGTNIDDASNIATNIGFTFEFDDIAYTKFSASTNGVIGLFRSWGSTAVTSCWTNELTATSGLCFGNYGATLDSIPQIAGYWDDMRVPGECNRDGFNGAVRYQVFGSAPSRVLVVEWLDIEFDYLNYQYTTFQVRLYEGSNAIEFWYAGFDTEGYNGDGGSIGIAAPRAASFVSITPGETATASSSSVNDNVYPLDIPRSALYTLSPCGPRFVGDATQGGTAAMTNGDTLFRTTTVQVGSSVAYTPFSVTVPGGACPSIDYSFQVTGLRASEYQISPTSGTIEAGSSLTPTITFTPLCDGPRPATLTMALSNGTQRVYTLRATATAQASYTGNIAQGGTATVASGDTLLGTIVVQRTETRDLQPLTITNTNNDPEATPLSVTFDLVDPTGQYTISTTSESLGSGVALTPTITFHATGVSAQEATLTVTAGCDTRTYLLRAFSAAPGGILLADGVSLDSSMSLYNGLNSCVGSDANVIPITVRNTGNGDFIIQGISIYRTDTVYTQGTGPFPLLRDAQNQPIPSTDYMLMLSPGSAPLTPEQALALPFHVVEGTSRTIYLVFVGSEAGRRYARVYIQTNGLNQSATNAFGVETEGLLRFDLVARAVGSQLASTPAGAPMRPVILPSVAVDDTSTTTFAIANAGACDLVIRRDKLAIIAGDVHEFALLDVLPLTPVDAAANTYRIAPGATDYITVRFTPSRSGTRNATLFLQTNDSAISLPGLSERGAYRLDLYGFGRAGLDANSVVLDPVLIGDVVSGIATLENSSTGLVEIRQISIVGPDAADFRASAAKPWPALPARVLPGSKLELGVELAPTGAAGLRRAFLEVITTTEDTILVSILGEAGVAALEVGPTSLFDDVQIPVGQYVRRNVTITNNGTFPIRIQQPTISGPDAGNYSIHAMPRLDLIPGQTEYLEVTFSPLGQGVSSATLEIQSSLGIRTVQLGGESLEANGEKDPVDGARNGGSRDGVSGIVTGESAELRVEAIRPNPTNAGAELGFTIGTAGTVVVTLHDGAGRLVERVADGRFEAGRHSIRFDSSTLANGTYHVRVAIGGTTTSTTLTVAK